MKVKDIMTTEVRSCTPTTTAAEAAHLMWDGDCGMLPVVEHDHLVGVVTDRDLYIALATRNAWPARLTVADVATPSPATCTPEDDVRTALATMKSVLVRRLPVVGFGGALLGVLSMNDVVLAAGPGKVAPKDVIETLQAICGHHPSPHVVAA